MGERIIKPTNCHFCGYLCAFNATVEDGRVVDLEPDPTRYPYDPTILAGCRRWRMNLDVLDSERRVNYPLRRVGERGSGEWERVSWDEALDDIAARLRALADAHGPEMLASMIGGPHTSFWPLHRFMNLFGSPNNMGIGQICWNPRIWMDVITFGWTVEADITPGLTGCVIVWGTNPADSDNSAWWQALRSLGKSDTPLIVIDPRLTQTASLADLWLPVRPGSDCALALSMIQVILDEGLEDRAFIDEWCHGFDELAAHVQAFAPEAVADTCGLDPEDIRQAARLFAKGSPSAIVSGRGVDQVGRNVAPTHRAICCLRAVTGNVDRQGACILAEQSDFTPEVELEMTAALPPERREKCLNTPYTPLQCYDGYERMRTITEKLGRTLPARYLTSAHPHLALQAMETGEPYPVRALIVEATNPLVTYADTHRVFKALMSLDLIVVLDYYLTPTASIADFVLPSAGAMERATFQQHGGVANNVYGGPAAVEPYYERKCDYDIFRELGIRLEQAESWPEETFEDACAAALERAGMSWDMFCAVGMYYQPPAPAKHALPGADGAPRGFATTTGKIELASEALAQLGGTRLPQPVAPGQTGGASVSPELAARGTQLTMITGARKQPYNASMYLDNPKFRRQYPYPLAEMSEQTAKDAGLMPGECVTVATDKGEAQFILKTAKMRDGVVQVDYGWWHPEWEPKAPEFGGIWESNVNCVTTVELGEPMIGTWSYNDIPCVVYKSQRPMTFGPDDLK